MTYSWCGMSEPKTGIGKGERTFLDGKGEVDRFKMRETSRSTLGWSGPTELSDKLKRR